MVAYFAILFVVQHTWSNHGDEQWWLKQNSKDARVLKKKWTARYENTTMSHFSFSFFKIRRLICSCSSAFSVLQLSLPLRLLLCLVSKKAQRCAVSPVSRLTGWGRLQMVIPVCLLWRCQDCTVLDQLVLPRSLNSKQTFQPWGNILSTTIGWCRFLRFCFIVSVLIALHWAAWQHVVRVKNLGAC